MLGLASRIYWHPVTRWALVIATLVMLDWDMNTCGGPDRLMP